jgi:hypothetical protein
MDYYFTLLKAKFGVTVGGYKKNKMKVQMNQYFNQKFQIDAIY